LKLRFEKPVKRPKPKKRVRKARPAKPGVPSIKQLDGLARALCRRRGGCEAAGYVAPWGHALACKGSLQWAHIVGRAAHRVRWEPWNCFLLCAAHHLYWTHRYTEFEVFVVVKLGASNFDALRRRSLPSEPKADRRAVLGKLSSRALAASDEWRNPWSLDTRGSQ
jgi:hypothetical protein